MEELKEGLTPILTGLHDNRARMAAQSEELFHAIKNGGKHCVISPWWPPCLVLIGHHSSP
jgi:lipoate-protein ligase A